LAELLSLGSLSVASSLDLVLVASGEGNSKNSHEVAVVSLGLNESLNEGVPFLDKRAKLVTGDVHTVEVGVAVETFDFLDLDLDLSPRNFVSLVVELTKRDGEDTTTEGVSSDLLTSGLVARGQGGNSDVENAGHMYVIPFFLLERMDTKFIHHQALVCFRI